MLPTRCVVGRAASSDLVAADRSVSSTHAAIEWVGAGWQLRDLGSRNGSIVDNRRLLAGSRAPLVVGSRVQFGSDPTIWVLAEATAPELMARQVESGVYRFADGDYMALPDLQAPEWSVYQDTRGGWLGERGGEVAPIEDRAVIAVGTTLWRVYLPGDGGDGASVAIERLLLRFVVQDGEIEVIAEAPGSRWRVAASGRMLLALARRRLADRAGGASEQEAGWTREDELLRALQLDAAQLDLRIHQARAQIGRIGVRRAGGLIERRSELRQLRIGVVALEV